MDQPQILRVSENTSTLMVLVTDTIKVNSKKYVFGA